MKLGIQLYNFSYYHSSDTAYIIGTVVKVKQTTDDKITNILLEPSYLENKKLNFKYTGKDIPQVLNLLRDRIVKVTVTEVEDSKDPKHGPKYIITKVEQCDILQVYLFIELNKH